MYCVAIFYVIMNHKYILLAVHCHHTTTRYSMQVHIQITWSFNMTKIDHSICIKNNDRSMNLHLRSTHLFFGRQKLWHRQFIHTEFCVVAPVNKIICNILWISNCEIVLIWAKILMLCNIIYNLWVIEWWRFFIA